jgi:hypothetical protein
MWSGFRWELRARPTLELLRDIAPDVREVLNLIEAFGMEAPVPDLRERADAATAEYIGNQVPPHGQERNGMLRALQDEAVAPAVAAARAAYDASVEAAEGSKCSVMRRRRGITGSTRFASALNG